MFSFLVRPAHVQITAQKMKFSIKDFFSKCDQIPRFMRIWSHLLKKSLMENFIFCAVNVTLQFKVLVLVPWSKVLVTHFVRRNLYLQCSYDCPFFSMDNVDIMLQKIPNVVLVRIMLLIHFFNSDYLKEINFRGD